PNSDAEELAQQRKASHIKTYTERGTGMRITKIALDPLRDQQWTLAWKAHIKRLRNQPEFRRLNWQQLEVEAFLAAITSPANSPAVPGQRSGTTDRPHTHPPATNTPSRQAGNDRPQPAAAANDSRPDAEHTDGDRRAPSTPADGGSGESRAAG